ncbi:MAG: hypothetical protein WCO55_04655 [Candidatus Falkowbacteria bacterium]
MNNISEIVQAKIEAEHIAPEPKWHFMARRSVFWLLTIGSIVLGIVSTAVILNIIENSDWDAYNRFELVFMAVPYLWLVMFAAFVVAAYYNFRHSKRGYHYPLFLIVGVTLFCSIVGGFFFYRAGWGEDIHEILIVRVPRYERAFDTRMMAWQNPHMGLLAGRIIEVHPADFRLQDFAGHDWQVLYGPQTVLAPQMVIMAGERVKLIGINKDDDIFEAREIRQWQPRKKNPRPAYYIPQDNGRHGLEMAPPERP